MNLDKLKKSGGWRMELRPPACHLNAQGRALPSENEDWIVEDVTDDEVRLRTASGYIARLGKDHIHHFATNPPRQEADLKFGFLILNVQVFTQGTRLFVEPNARPGEPVAAPQNNRVTAAGDGAHAMPAAPVQAAEPISIECVSETPKIKDYTPVCGVRIRNMGATDFDNCLVQIDRHGLKHVPDPLVLRTDGQIRGNRTGRFELSGKQPKLVPILFRGRRRDELLFISEHREEYLVGSARGVSAFVSVFGAGAEVERPIAITIGPDWEVTCRLAEAVREPAGNDAADGDPELKIADLVRAILNLEKFDMPDPEGRIGRTLFQIRQKAIYGNIAVWGRIDSAPEWDDLEIIPRTKIRQEFWETQKINEYEFVMRDGRSITVSDGKHYEQSYSDLAVSRRDARKAWPAANL